MQVVSTNGFFTFSFIATAPTRADPACISEANNFQAAYSLTIISYNVPKNGGKLPAKP